MPNNNAIILVRDRLIQCMLSILFLLIMMSQKYKILLMLSYCSDLGKKFMKFCEVVPVGLLLNLKD